MSPLVRLRSQLAALRRRRRSIRVAAALFALVVGVLWTLAVLFVLDWLFAMNRLQRGVAIVAGIGAIIWAYRRYTGPLLAKSESEIDVALLVEKQQQLPSDLVAALQFESPDASRWGSVHLERAVIDYVADFSREWQVNEPFWTTQIIRRLSLLAATAAIVLAFIAGAPGYFTTFIARLGMSNQHYPTRTTIDEVRINGAVVAGQATRAGYGQPVEFAVAISGVTPQDVKRVELKSVAGGDSHPLDLTLDPKAPADHPVFKGQMAQLVDTLDYQVYLGDDWTDPARLEVIPLPEVEVKLVPSPPAYARSATSEQDQSAGTRQLAVLEGSHVDLEINCFNKPLTAATLKIERQLPRDPKKPDAKPEVETKQIPLVARDADGHRWGVPAKDSPLARVDSELRYEIQVTDSDGLHLPHPLDGYVRIKVDRPPTVFATVDVQYFLPNQGVPEINYTASDDYGIAGLQMKVDIVHQDSSGVAEPAGPLIALMKPKAEPVLRPKLPLTGTYRLALDQYKLVKGDELRVYILATDYRGDAEGKTTTSEPLVLQITDESGIMAALSETDRHAYEQMNVLIQRQTQTGGLK